MIRIEKVSLMEMDEAYLLIQTVWSESERKEWFVIDEKEVYLEHLRNKTGVLYQAYDEETQKMAGMFFVVLPGDAEENLGRDAGLMESELPKVAHMDTAAVLPKYRGQGLQYQMMQKAERDLKTMGYRYLMCTVHPKNEFSRNNVLRQGYQVAMTKEKYGGYLRDILWKEI